ncbi:MAG TPA: aspartate carbamoyltransferase [Gammaproteobacteria bacterium]
MASHKAWKAGVLVTLMAVTAVVQADPTARQKEVAQKGGMVMPFDLHNSTHIFMKSGDGGTQQVLAKDPTDLKLIQQIRIHLGMEAERFSRGDFTDPMRIHGADMPGLSYLRYLKPGQVQVKYHDLPNGAEIQYSGRDKAAVDALHQWFDAQLSDHGQDATDQPPG